MKEKIYFLTKIFFNKNIVTYLILKCGLLIGKYIKVRLFKIFWSPHRAFKLIKFSRIVSQDC